ncbi:MAG: T9SS type A sorting domain-containing protein [Saprospiraceae bacterium]
MRTFILKALLYTLLSANAVSTLAQTVNWVYVAGEQSSAEILSLLSNGSYLITSQSSDTSATNEVTKLSNTGNLLWERDFDNSAQRLIFAAEQSSDDLIFVAVDGLIYQADANGDGAVLIDQLAPSSSTRIRNFHYDVTFGDTAYFIASVTVNGLDQTLRASLDLETLAISRNLGEDESYPNGIAFSNTGTRAELRSNIQGAGIYFYDENLEISSIVDITQPGNVFFSDLTFDEHGNLYVIGTGGDLSTHAGLIALIDTNKVLRWVKELPRPTGYESLGLKHIVAREGRLFIGGRSGPTSDRIEGFVGEIDAFGNLIWETTIDATTNGEAVISLEYVLGTNANELIAFGTGGLTDFIGPHRTFLASIALTTSSTNEEDVTETPLFYPSPVADLLHVDPKLKFTSIEVINANGALLNTISTGENTFDMSSYPSGVYFLKSYFEGSSTTSIVIKK